MIYYTPPVRNPVRVPVHVVSADPLYVINRTTRPLQEEGKPYWVPQEHLRDDLNGKEIDWILEWHRKNDRRPTPPRDTEPCPPPPEPEAVWTLPASSAAYAACRLAGVSIETTDETAARIAKILEAEVGQ